MILQILLLAITVYADSTVFPNGVELLVEENPASRTAAIVISVEGAYEHKTGLCGITANLLNKDNGRFTETEMNNIIGATGGNFRASGGSDTFYLRSYVPSEDIGKALDILFSMLINPLMKKEDLEKAKEYTVSSVLAQNDSTDYLIYNEMFRQLFKGHAYREKLLADNLDEFRSISIDEVKSYHEEMLKGGNIKVAVAGNVNGGDIKEAVKILTAGIPSGSFEKEIVPLRKLDREIRSAVRKRTTETQILVAGLTAPLSVRERTVLSVIDQVLDGFKTGITEEIREKRGYAYWVDVGSGVSEDGGYWLVRSGVKKKNFEEVEEIIRSELNKIATVAVSERTMEQAKKKLILDLYKNDINRTRADYICRKLATGEKIVSTAERAEDIKSVTAEEITDLTGRLYLNCEYAVITLY